MIIILFSLSISTYIRYVITASHGSSISSELLQYSHRTTSTNTTITSTPAIPVTTSLPATVLQVKASRSIQRPERDEYSLGVVDSESIWSMITLLLFSWINIHHHHQQQQLSGQQQHELLQLKRYNDNASEHIDDILHVYS